MRGPRRSLLLAVAVAVAAATLVVPASAATAASATIVGVGSGRCLDVRGAVRTAKAPVVIYDCHGGANQSWTLSSSGALTVYDAATCLDVSGASTTPGAAVQIYPCHGGTNQRWTLAADGSIRSAQSGLCLDVSGRATANSSAVIVWTCNGQTNQRWNTGLRADTKAPSVPGNPRTSSLTCDSVTFAWDAATDDVGVAAYDVYHDGQLMRSVGGSTLSSSLSVVGGVTWGLYVNARDASGNVSQASTTVSITPPPCQVDTRPPSAPSALRATASGTTVTLTWSASTDDVGVRAYDVYRGATKVGTTTGTAATPPVTTFVDSGLTPSTTYSYTVAARDAQGNVSMRSAAATVTTGAACGSAVCGVTQVGTDTDVPWGLVTLPDGSIMYSRRDAHDIVRLDPATGVKQTVGTVPNVAGTDGEGGLMGLAISPTYSSDHWLYVMHTSPTDNRIVRIKVENGVLVTSSEQILLSGILRNKFHDGGRLRFGPDGKLYASTGDAQNGDNAQNVASLNGKVLRLNPDGTVPSDNPFGNYVWSYGHRNPQGLAFDSQGRLWEQEFGNSVMDETNLITKGGNYGWPACEGTTGTCGTAGYIAPKRTYPTADGSCSGIAIVRDVLYVACERGTRMYREVIAGSALTDVQSYFNGTYGRLRTVEPAPDGGLWLTTSTTGDKDSIPPTTATRSCSTSRSGDLSPWPRIIARGRRSRGASVAWVNERWSADEAVRVVRADKGSLLVAPADGGGPVRVTLARDGLADLDGVRAVPTVGDWVTVDEGLVRAIRPRTSALVRDSAGATSREQVLAANVDVVLVVEHLDPDPDLGRVERLLTLAWRSGARPVVVLTKADLVPDPEAMARDIEGVAIAVDVHAVSATTGDGLGPLRALLTPGTTLVVVGPSGAGKSTLVNALAGAEVMPTGDRREVDGRGRHTTTHRELVPLSGGAVLVDTPGIRGVGLVADDEALDTAFADVAALVARCRFADCQHAGEPGCAVAQALADGELSRRRYDSYVKLAREAAYQARRTDAHLRAEERARWKRIALDNRRDARGGHRIRP